ncbi:MAG: pectin methylesterase [Clostridia bacterium]|nr:pectin methylesterase [Clostridia bacterium]
MEIIVSKSGSAAFTALQAAIDSIPADGKPVTIHIKPGVYREKVILNKDNITLLADEGAHLVFDDFALNPLPDGTTRNTFLTPTLLITGDNVTLRGLTVENNAGDGRKVGQAVAVYAAGDRCRFFDCRLLAAQDTLFCGPVLHKLHRFVKPYEIPLGVEGVADRPPVDARLYFERCFIRGDVDFIFGPYRCWFENCTLYANQRGGYYTAANTPEGQPYGFVFHRCQLTGECQPGGMYLGRPWREHAATAFINCQMDECVHPEGFTDWLITGQPNRPVTERYCEYGSLGAGADSSRRHPGMKLLTTEEAAAYTLQNVLPNWDPLA